MLVLTHASLATIDELFRYKHQQFRLPDFPGYTPDQWGIKAHNRPWIEEKGNFSKSQRIIEVGGAYSLLVHYLSEKYKLEAWIGDDFGGSDQETSAWQRWGNPYDLPRQYPSIKYVFEPFGIFSSNYPDRYFDRILSVSTLEHIPCNNRLPVLKDMNRCLKQGGMQLHTIDIKTRIAPREIIKSVIRGKSYSEIKSWIQLFRNSGVKVSTSIPGLSSLLKRQILVESPDVVYRFYPPNNAPKPYYPGASLLLIIEDQ